MALYLALKAETVGSHGLLPAPRAFTPAPPLPSGEALYASLDGRELILLGQRFSIDVFSVCTLGPCQYVQLALRGPEQYMLTLRVASGVGSGRVVSRLLSWLSHPSSSGEVLEVK